MNNNSNKNTDINSKKAAVNNEIEQSVHQTTPLNEHHSKSSNQDQKSHHQEGMKNEQGMNEQRLRTAGIQGFNNQHEFISDQIDPKLTVNQLQTNEQVGLVSGMKTMVINQVPIVEQRDVVVGTQPKYEEQDVIIGNVPIIEKRDVVVGSKPVYGKKKVMVGHVPVVEQRDVVVGQRMVVEQELNPEEIKNRNLVSEPVHQQTTQKTVTTTVPVIKTVPVTTTVPVIKQVPVVKQVPVNQIPAGAVPLDEYNRTHNTNLTNTGTTGSTMPRVVNPNTIPSTMPTTTVPTTTKNIPTQQPSVGLFKHGSHLLLKSKHDYYLSSDEDGKIKQSKERGNAETWTVESLGGNVYGLKNSASGSFLSSDDKHLRLNSARSEEEKWRVEMLEDGRYALSDYRGHYLKGGHFKHMSLSENLSDDDKWTVESV